MLKLIITKTKFKINRFLKKRQLSKQGVTIGTGSHFTGTHFEGHNYIGPHTCISHSEVGRYSYIGKNSSFDRALIGCFCSIGDDVKVIAAQHPTQGFVSTSPVFLINQVTLVVSQKEYNYFQTIASSQPPTIKSL